MLCIALVGDTMYFQLSVPMKLLFLDLSPQYPRTCNPDSFQLAFDLGLPISRCVFARTRYEFLGQFLTEMASVFNDDLIMLGGDEVGFDPKCKWPGEHVCGYFLLPLYLRVLLLRPALSRLSNKTRTPTHIHGHTTLILLLFFSFSFFYIPVHNTSPCSSSSCIRSWGFVLQLHCADIIALTRIPK